MANNNAAEGLIVKVAGNGKFLDFRNGLNLANPDDYAMIHGAGGGRHSFVSSIKLTLTDYSAGTGDKSVFLTYNLPLYVIDSILSVCRRNVGTTFNGDAEVLGGMDSKIQELNLKTDKILGALYVGLSKAVSACGKLVQGKGHEKGPFADFGQSLRAAKEALEAKKDAEPTQYTANAPYLEFTYSPDSKVNMYRPDPQDGYVPVSMITITRREFRQGKKSNYPWTVKITNVMAAPVKNEERGTVTWDKNRSRDKKEAFINISDDDMYRCCYAVDHFIRVWENGLGIPLVTTGVERAIAARQSR